MRCQGLHDPDRSRASFAEADKAVLEGLTAAPPPQLTITFNASEGVTATLRKFVAVMLQVNASNVAWSEMGPKWAAQASASHVYTEPRHFIDIIANMAAFRGSEPASKAVYLHFDDVGELSGDDFERLQMCMVHLAYDWTRWQSGRRLWFLFTGKGMRRRRTPSESDASIGTPHSLLLQPLTTKSIQTLQQRYCSLNPRLQEVRATPSHVQVGLLVAT